MFRPGVRPHIGQSFAPCVGTFAAPTTVDAAYPPTVTNAASANFVNVFMRKLSIAKV
jgi:hypothetical protein